jgi:hypothetical protein
VIGQAIARECGASKFVVIGFAQELPDRFLGVGLAHKSTEILVPEVPGDVFQTAEMVTRTIGRLDKQK